MADEQISTDVDDWLNDLDDQEEVGGDLGQDDIDSLLGEGNDEASSTAIAAAGAEEFDQSELDSLLGTGSDAEPASDGELSVQDLDQSDIDSLFASGFDDELEGDEVDFGEILGDSEEQEAGAAADQGRSFDPAQFTLEGTEVEELNFSGAPIEQPAAFKAKSPPEPGPALAAAMAASAESAGETTGVPLYMQRRSQFLGGGLLLLLLVGIAVFLWRGSGEQGTEVAVLEQTESAPAVESADEPQINRVPEAVSSRVQLPESSAAMALSLAASDADGDPLTYELIDFPAGGRLSGRLPSITYKPGSDFTGKDRFTFRVSDGVSFSNLAEVVISGGIPAKAAPSPVEEKKPAPVPAIAARDLYFATVSTEPLVIDWQDQWRQTNDGSFKGVSVTLETGTLSGSLVREGESFYRYRPPAFFSGREVFSYRFTKNGRSSGRKQVVIAVETGDHPPALRLSPIAEAVATGETVVLDASASRDDQRSSLVFVWQQVAGASVALTSMNREGSIVSFVMPSFFSSETNPVITLEVTVGDQAGQTDRQTVSIRSVSRRNRALWQGIADTSARW